MYLDRFHILRSRLTAAEAHAVHTWTIGPRLESSDYIYVAARGGDTMRQGRSRMSKIPVRGIRILHLQAWCTPGIAPAGSAMLELMHRAGMVVFKGAYTRKRSLSHSPYLRGDVCRIQLPEILRRRSKRHSVVSGRQGLYIVVVLCLFLAMFLSCQAIRYGCGRIGVRGANQRSVHRNRVDHVLLPRTIWGVFRCHFDL